MGLEGRAPNPYPVRPSLSLAPGSFCRNASPHPPGVPLSGARARLSQG